MADYKIDINDSDFDKVVIEQSSKVPVLVDFWASWCGPCVMLAPVLEKLAKEYRGKFILAKLNVEENQEIQQEYGVMSIPSVKLFKDGDVVNEFVGAISESEIRSFLDSSLD